MNIRSIARDFLCLIGESHFSDSIQYNESLSNKVKASFPRAIKRLRQGEK